MSLGFKGLGPKRVESAAGFPAVEPDSDFRVDGPGGKEAWHRCSRTSESRKT